MVSFYIPEGDVEPEFEVGSVTTEEEVRGLTPTEALARGQGRPLSAGYHQRTIQERDSKALEEARKKEQAQKIERARLQKVRQAQQRYKSDIRGIKSIQERQERLNQYREEVGQARLEAQSAKVSAGIITGYEIAREKGKPTIEIRKETSEALSKALKGEYLTEQEANKLRQAGFPITEKKVVTETIIEGKQKPSYDLEQHYGIFGKARKFWEEKVSQPLESKWESQQYALATQGGKIQYEEKPQNILSQGVGFFASLPVFPLVALEKTSMYIQEPEARKAFKELTPKQQLVEVATIGLSAGMGYGIARDITSSISTRSLKESGKSYITEKGKGRGRATLKELYPKEVKFEINEVAVENFVRNLIKKRGYDYNKLSKIEQDWFKGQVKARIRNNPEQFIPEARRLALQNLAKQKGETLREYSLRMLETRETPQVKVIEAPKKTITKASDVWFKTEKKPVGYQEVKTKEGQVLLLKQETKQIPKQEVKQVSILQTQQSVIEAPKMVGGLGQQKSVYELVSQRERLATAQKQPQVLQETFYQPQRESLASVALPKQEMISMTKQEQRERQATAMMPGLKQKQKLAQKEKLRETQLFGEAQILGLKQISALKQKQAQKSQLKQVLIQKYRTIQKLRQKYLFDFPKDEKEKTSPSLLKTRSSGFKVWERRYGKWKPLKEFKTKREAKVFGASRVSHTLGASLMVTRRGKKERLTLPRMFRPAKREVGVYVQKRRFRLSSPQERRAILKARKQKSSSIF